MKMNKSFMTSTIRYCHVLGAYIPDAPFHYLAGSLTLTGQTGLLGSNISISTGQFCVKALRLDSS